MASEGEDAGIVAGDHAVEVEEEEEEDQWAKLPDEVQQKIFKLCRWRQLFRACCVCKSFNEGVNRYVMGLPLFVTAVPESKS